MAHYDHTTGQNGTVALTAPEQNSLSINLPQNNGESERERSLTLGSEFDGWSMGGRDERGMSFSGILTPMGEPDAEETTASTTGTAVADTSHLPSIAEQAVVQTSIPLKPEEGVSYQRTETQSIPLSRPRGDSMASTSSQFLRLISHTPPSSVSTSYEKSRFGKRSRQGVRFSVSAVVRTSDLIFVQSISGRLRSASDLEDHGVISQEQKAILKDLIVAGDGSVQAAIDKYESGDPSALEAMIKKGQLVARASGGVDLLGDMDLDFLNFNNDDANNDSMFEDREKESSHADVLMGDSKPSAVGMPPLPAVAEESTHHNYDTEPIPVQQSPRKYSTASDLDVHRARTNSLALPGLLLDGANPEDVGQLSFSQWMDKELSQARAQAEEAEEAEKRKSQPLSSECDDLMASTEKERQTRSRKKSPKKKPSLPTKKDREKKEKAEKAKKEKPKQKRASKKKEVKPKEEPKPIVYEQVIEQGPREVPSGLGRPRSMSDPNLSVRLDDYGLLHVDGPEGWTGAYSPTSRQLRVDRWKSKRGSRIWVKKVKYDVRKNFAESRLRVKGRFVKKEDETLMRELMSLS